MVAISKLKYLHTLLELRSNLIIAHPDLLDPGVQGDGEDVEAGVRAHHAQPRREINYFLG